MDRSRPGSVSRAAAMLSSRARLTGFLPWACDRTTVRRWLMKRLSVDVDLTLDQPLGLFPVVGQELVILGHRQQGVSVALVHVKEPAGPVAVHVDARGVLEQFGVETPEDPG